MEYCGAHVSPWPAASWPRSTISLASCGLRSTAWPTMWEVTLMFLRIPEVEQARDAFLDAVVVPGLDRQVRVSRIERREGAFRSPFRFGASLALPGEGNRGACRPPPQPSPPEALPAHTPPPATLSNTP